MVGGRRRRRGGRRRSQPRRRRSAWPRRRPSFPTEALAEQCSPARRAAASSLLYGDGCGVQRLDAALARADRRRSERLRAARRRLAGRRARRPLRRRRDRARGALGARLGDRQHLPGCAPAWRPDGTLTVSLRRRGRDLPAVRGTEPVRRDADRPRPARARGAAPSDRVPTGPVRLRALVDGIAWLSNTARGGAALDPDSAAGSTGSGRSARSPSSRTAGSTPVAPYFRLTGGRLAASPRGTYVTHDAGRDPAPDGSQVSLPQHLRGARDFAWSPDERLLALATPFAVDDRRRREPRTLRPNGRQACAASRCRSPPSDWPGASRAHDPRRGRSRPAGSRRRACRSGSASRSRRAARRTAECRSGCRP